MSLKPSPSNTPSGTTLFLLALVFRLVNACITRTFFQPDEYYQALEPAHRLIFGTGYATWEWRSIASSRLSSLATDGGVIALLRNLMTLNSNGFEDLLSEIGEGRGGIRSPLGFLIPLIGYWVVKVTGLESTRAIVLAPKIAQATVAAVGDFAVFRLAERVLGKRYALTAFTCSLTSFFNFYASTRTFSNSTETVLTTLALSYWPWKAIRQSSDIRSTYNSSQTSHRLSFILSLSFAGIATIMRPSNAIIWVILGIHLIWVTKPFFSKIVIISDAIVVASITVLITFLIDTTFYTTSTFTPYSFLSQNVFESMSSFYGLSSSHYYLSQAIPILLFTQLPFFLHGYWLSYCAKGRSITRGSESVLRYVIGGTVGVYSLLAHKEWRFIYPLLPILHLFSTISLVEGWEKYQISKSSSTPAEAISQGKGTTSKGLNIFDRILVTKLHLALITFSLIPAIYLTSFHSVGQISVMEDLRTVPQMSINLDLSFESLGQLGRSLAVLMPCHSTPWMSHLHWDKEAEERSWFLECEPPVLGQNRSRYKHQEDFFYANPFRYLIDRFPSSINGIKSDRVVEGSVEEWNEFDLGWVHPEWPRFIILFEGLFNSVPSDYVRFSQSNLSRDRVGKHDSSRREAKENELIEIRFGQVLINKGYRIKKRIWNSSFHEELRKGDIILLERS